MSAHRLLAWLLLLALAAFAPARAQAHAALISASPADGAVVATVPATFVLVFSEPVSPLVLRLIAPDGTSRLLDRFVLTDRTLDIAAPANLGHGTHVISWRVVSEDGHPIGGSLVFSIGSPAGAPGVLAPQGDRAVRALLLAGKLALYLGLFFGIGGAVFAVWAAALPQAARRISAAAMALGLGALPVAWAAQGLDALDAPISALALAEPWRAAAGTSFARTLALAGLALALGLASLRLTGRARTLAAMAALAGAGLSLAASGHASAAAPQGLMRPAVFLHGVGIAAWVGALWPLAVLLRGGGPEVAPALTRFSRRVPVVLAVLLASGVVLAIVQVETPQALLSTDYGRLLSIKLCWLAALLALAGLNRFRLTRPARAGELPACARLRRSIIAEIVLVGLVLCAVALWRFTPPPRALALAASRPASVHIHAPQAMAEVTVTPGRAGRVAVTIGLLSGDFGPLPAKALTLTAANPAAGIEPIERKAVLGEDGIWRVEALDLPQPGRWTLELEILVSDFELIRLSEAVEIAR